MNEVKAQIETLLYENAADFEIAKVLKQDIKTYFDTLEETFATSGGKDFLVKHGKKIDSILKLVFKATHRNMFGEYMPMKNSLPLAMVALGSYGREQLCVHSDIDLMFVYKEIPGYNMKEMIEKMLYMLWDAGLKLGHRVHTVDDLLNISKTDITIKTSLIESRFIEGSQFIWTETQNALTQIRYDDPSAFINAKLEEQKLKHEKFPLTMEPNLKEGVGGFRDANLVYWIGKVLFNANNIKNLPLIVVTEQEYREFRIALEFLFRVRSALHLVAGKKEDTLRLDLIPYVAKLLGYAHSKEGHRKFTKKVTGSLKVIRLYSIIWLDILSRGYVKSKDETSMVYPTDEFNDVHGLLEQLCTYAHTPFKVHATFLQKLIHAPKPEYLTPAYYETIRHLFYQPYTYSVLSALSYSRLLKYVIPPIKKVVDLPQFDGYHQYAVDIHSLMCLMHLEQIQDPFIAGLFDALSEDEKAMLKIVTFLHDAGKGREKDHHLVGATLFKLFAQNLHMEKTLIAQGITLIHYHTLMSIVSQNEDLHNEKVILKFASHFQSKKLLDFIYILTYADMSGVGKGIYNTFNAKLIKTLYTLSLEVLDHKEALNETAKRVKKEKLLKKDLTFKALKKSQQKKILAISSNLLFIRYSTSEIIDIAGKAFALSGFSYSLKNRSYLTIEILREKSINLGYLLSKLGHLGVRNMDIAKLFDAKKYFKIDFSEKVTEDDLVSIRQIIEASFYITERGTCQSPLIKEQEIKIDCNHSNNYASLYLKCKDKKGLLAYVIDLFDSMDIEVATAKIHTFRKQTNDIFLIEKNGNFCHNVDTVIEKLTKG